MYVVKADDVIIQSVDKVEGTEATAVPNAVPAAASAEALPVSSLLKMFDKVANPTGSPDTLPLEASPGSTSASASGLDLVNKITHSPARGGSAR
jgi:hypothetical protein